MKVYSAKPLVDAVRCGLLGTFVCLALQSATAHAELGGDVSSIDRDQARLKGERRQVSVQTHVVVNRAQALSVATQETMAHEITQADGSVIREYLTPSGIVYAVTWQTHFRPDLGALFGQHAASYMASAKEAMKTPGIKRNVALQSKNLIVHATSHFNIFIGQAYVPSLVPSGVNVHELR